MPVELTYPHIEKPASASARLQRVPRVRVSQIVMDYLAHGWSAEEMCRQHSYLMPSEIHAALGYYFDHQDEIDSEIRAEWNAVQAASPLAASALLVRMRGKGTLPALQSPRHSTSLPTLMRPAARAAPFLL